MAIDEKTGMEGIPIIAAGGMLARLPEKRTEEKRALALTKRGKPVLVVIQWDLHESILETTEIPEDPATMDGIRESIEDMRQGNLIFHTEVMEGLDDQLTGLP